jgi:phage-related protein
LGLNGHYRWMQDKRYRVSYVATRPDAISVLHAFEKTTQKTTAHDLRIGRDRFGALRKLELEHGKKGPG